MSSRKTELVLLTIFLVSKILSLPFSLCIGPLLQLSILCCQTIIHNPLYSFKCSCFVPAVRYLKSLWWCCKFLVLTSASSAAIFWFHFCSGSAIPCLRLYPSHFSWLIHLQLQQVPSPCLSCVWTHLQGSATTLVGWFWSISHHIRSCTLPIPSTVWHCLNQTWPLSSPLLS